MSRSKPGLYFSEMRGYYNYGKTYILPWEAEKGVNLSEITFLLTANQIYCIHLGRIAAYFCPNVGLLVVIEGCGWILQLKFTKVSAKLSV